MWYNVKLHIVQQLHPTSVTGTHFCSVTDYDILTSFTVLVCVCVCVCLCLYVCLSARTHVGKCINTYQIPNDHNLDDP